MQSLPSSPITLLSASIFSKRENLMQTHLLLIAGFGAMLVAGCSGAEEKPRKGKYKPQVTLTALELPGMTPDIKAQAENQMKVGFASQVGGEQCLGATEKGEWKKVSDQISKSMGGQCTTIKDASTDTSVDLQVKCTGTQMGDVTATIKGAAESESFGMDINLGLDKLPNGAGMGKLGMRIDAKRTGDC
jgi:hypothetical protein